MDKQRKAMRLCAIYTVWSDGLDLLKPSVENILPVVDEVIIVFSNYSNYGHFISFTCMEPNEKIRYVNFEPNLNLTPHENECAKRNWGLTIAKELGFTHFVMLDADEFYERHAFWMQRQVFEVRDDLAGMVCGTKVYFKSPTLTVGMDHTLAPFIHKITPGLRFQLNGREYPFAYDQQANAHIDPTRRLNITSGVEMSDIIMHHFSWVRSDYNLKIENSAARKNLRKSSIYKDLDAAAPGVYNQFYRAEIQACPNLFNL